ncbi:type II secretion protein F [Salmonella enterica]|uniref:Type II secretion protein F n=1 Tax=Salmonella enterica subsp. enterica serovar Javiana TaxID=363569 RepID=A0A733YGL7_SALET|nr:type II secretion protein F [Salmonella enterica subsp. enterica serovar Javiana]EBA9399127.1 type II secretion protein F [Salmonella enterica]EBY8519347.1 type II secretion protein F [Salmonella enterica subsp. enterica serovar Braenderup]ECD6768005.1 type II secretion protein F [Salmonella enterica subsp. enterica serovar Newport]EHE0685204.1 type II secretion protein F [Salmonella enterica subsp. enterica serovar Eastbourne]
MAKFTKKQRFYLYQFCADMLKADLPLYDSVVKLQTEGRTLLGAGFVKKLQAFLDKMATTESVAGVFEGFVPRVELGVIYSSEKSGALAEGFLSIVATLKFEQQLRSQLIKAVTFPLIMLCLALVVIGGYAVKVFPAFEKVIPTSRWPGITQVLYSFGTELYHGLWIHIIVAFVVVVIVIRLVMYNVTGKLRNNILDRVLPFSTYKRMSASLFLSSLSAMMRNNIPLNESLDVIRLNANRWMKSHLAIMQNNMALGQPYGKAMNTGLLGASELLNISLYSSLPSFYDVLVSVSERARKDIAENIEWLAGILRSLATVVLGGCVVWVFGALYALSDSISQMSSFH